MPVHPTTSTPPPHSAESPIVASLPRNPVDIAAAAARSLLWFDERQPSRGASFLPDRWEFLFTSRISISDRRKDLIRRSLVSLGTTVLASFRLSTSDICIGVDIWWCVPFLPS